MSDNLDDVHIPSVVCFQWKLTDVSDHFRVDSRTLNAWIDSGSVCAVSTGPGLKHLPVVINDEVVVRGPCPNGKSWPAAVLNLDKEWTGTKDDPWIVPDDLDLPEIFRSAATAETLSQAQRTIEILEAENAELHHLTEELDKRYDGLDNKRWDQLADLVEEAKKSNQFREERGIRARARRSPPRADDR